MPRVDHEVEGAGGAAGVAQAFELQLGGPLGRPRQPAGLVARQVDQLAQLVDAGEQVVPDVELAGELREAGQHRGHHELGCHELTQCELAVEHEAAAEHEQHRAREHLDHLAADDLAEVDPEVVAAAQVPLGQQGVGLLDREPPGAPEAEGPGVSRDLFDPACHLVLGLALVDGGAGSAAPQREEDAGEGADHQHVEGEQDRVVGRQQHQTHQRLQGGRAAVEHERAGRLLHGDGVEEPVDHLGAGAAVEGAGAQPAQSPRHVGGDANEDAPLHHLDRDPLQHPQARGERETEQQPDRQRHQRLEQRAEGEPVDEHLHDQRRREAQHADADRVEQDRAEVLPFGPEERAQSAERRQGGRAIAAGRQRRGWQRGLDHGPDLGTLDRIGQRRDPFAEPARGGGAGHLTGASAAQAPPIDHHPGAQPTRDQRPVGAGLGQRGRGGREHPAHPQPDRRPGVLERVGPAQPRRGGEGLVSGFTGVSHRTGRGLARPKGHQQLSQLVFGRRGLGPGTGDRVGHRTSGSPLPLIRNT